MPTDASTRFVMRLFAKHYRESNLAMPERFAKREFGFMFFDRQFVMRHLGFPSRAALKNHLVEQVPAHAYHSCAYYEKPDAPTMKEKGWLGADLIFDLDADHVEGTKGLSYEQMLDRVKEEMKHLLDDFLLGDFGFDHDDLKIVFSGGRGYHVHINSPRVLKLTSHERREIVDYIIGTDLDMEWVFPQTAIETEAKSKEWSKPAHKRTMPRLEDGGWRGRIRKGIDELLAELDALDADEAKGRIAQIVKDAERDIGKKTVDGVYKDLFAKARGKRGVDRMREEDNFEVFSEKRHADAFLELVDRRVKGRMKGETDEPVTSDIKRLIRLPSSLHGKTGFEVLPMTRDELDVFDPFVDAVPEAFGDATVRVVCEKPVDLRMKDRHYALDAGANDVPEHVAVFLVCRKLAKVETQ